MSPAKLSVLVVGCGDLGCRLPTYLPSSHYTIYGLRRDTSSLPSSITPISADYTSLSSLTAALRPHLPFTYVIITQTPTSFTPASYALQYPTSTSLLLTALSAAPPRRILYTSSTSVYAPSLTPITESTPPSPQLFNGAALLSAEDLLRASPIPSSILRVAGLYGGLSPKPPLSSHPLLATSRPPKPRGVASMVHRADAARAMAHVVTRDAQGSSVAECYVVADGEPAENAVVVRWLVERARREGVQMEGVEERWMGAAEGEAEGEAEGLGKRCVGERLREEGFEMEFPSFREGLCEAYSGI